MYGIYWRNIIKQSTIILFTHNTQWTSPKPVLWSSKNIKSKRLKISVSVLKTVWKAHSMHVTKLSIARTSRILRHIFFSLHFMPLTFWLALYACITPLTSEPRFSECEFSAMKKCSLCYLPYVFILNLTFSLRIKNVSQKNRSFYIFVFVLMK